MRPQVVETAPSLDQFEAASWPSTTVPDSLYLSRHWLRSQEAHIPGETFCILLRDPDSRAITAAMPCRLVQEARDWRFDDCPRVLLDTASPRNLLTGLTPEERQEIAILRQELCETRCLRYPALVATAPNAAMFGYATTADHSADRSEIEIALLRAFNDVADRLAVPTRTFWYVRPSQFSYLADNLVEDGYLETLINADCHLDVNFTTFDEYLARLSASRRQAVKREIRHFESAGLTVELCGASVLDETAAELHSDLMRRYRRPVEVAAVMASFRSMHERFGDDMLVAATRRDGRIIGFLVLIRHGSTLYCRQPGFVPGSGKSTSFVYFNTIFYSPIRYGIANGIGRIEYGTESYEAKLPRGCFVTPLNSYIKVVTGSDPLRRYLHLYDIAVRKYLALDVNGLANHR